MRENELLERLQITAPLRLLVNLRNCASQSSVQHNNVVEMGSSRRLDSAGAKGITESYFHSIRDSSAQEEYVWLHSLVDK